MNLADVLRHTWPQRHGDKWYVRTEKGLEEITGPADKQLAAEYARAWMDMFLGYAVYVSQKADS